MIADHYSNDMLLVEYLRVGIMFHEDATTLPNIDDLIIVVIRLLRRGGEDMKRSKEPMTTMKRVLQEHGKLCD
jgi:hypothetical protein